MKSKIVANILMTVMVGAALVFVGWIHPPAWTAVESVSAFFAAAGFVLWTVARFELGSSFTLTAQAKQLVTRGLYAKLRNPIYYFGSLTIAGSIVLLGRPYWLLIFVLIIPMQIWRARVEARVLQEKFGEEYRNYRARTWF